MSLILTHWAFKIYLSNMYTSTHTHTHTHSCWVGRHKYAQALNNLFHAIVPRKRTYFCPHIFTSTCQSEVFSRVDRVAVKCMLGCILSRIEMEKLEEYGKNLMTWPLQSAPYGQTAAPICRHKTSHEEHYGSFLSGIPYFRNNIHLLILCMVFSMMCYYFSLFLWSNLTPPPNTERHTDPRTQTLKSPGLCWSATIWLICTPTIIFSALLLHWRISHSLPFQVIYLLPDGKSHASLERIIG